MPEPYFVDWSTRPQRDLFPGVRIAVASGERLMLSRVALEPGAVVPEHHHPHEQFGLVLEGEATFTIGGETRLLRAGDYYAIPGDVTHGVVSGPGGSVCLDIFSPPREEYLPTEQRAAL
jgi:quercetin dioxygenase-like cupin family protein